MSLCSSLNMQEALGEHSHAQIRATPCSRVPAPKLNMWKIFLLFLRVFVAAALRHVWEGVEQEGQRAGMTRGGQEEEWGMGWKRRWWGDCACMHARTRKRGQTGRKIDQHETASGRGRTDMRADEERRPEDCSFESSAGAVAFKYSLGPFRLQRSHTVTFLYR